MNTSHIVKSYDEQLTRLQTYIASMGSLVQHQFAQAIQAIHARDNEIAGQAFAQDNEVDSIEQDLNDLALEMLALRQPMASDLRLIIGTMRIARDLERIGDYAASTAKRARRINAHAKISITSGLLRMANLVQPVLREVVDAYTRLDIDKATAIYKQDDIIDEAYKKLIEDLVAYMRSHPDAIESCTQLLFMAKNFERIGDRATNIAETIHFIARGTMPVARKYKQLPNS